MLLCKRTKPSGSQLPLVLGRTRVVSEPGQLTPAVAVLLDLERAHYQGSYRAGRLKRGLALAVVLAARDAVCEGRVAQRVALAVAVGLTANAELVGLKLQAVVYPGRHELTTGHANVAER